MHAHLIQLDIAWENPAENFVRVDRLITQATIQPGDLILLPEMFSVGFSLNTRTTADRGQTLDYLQRLATNTRTIVQGGRTILPTHGTLATNVMSVLDGIGGGDRGDGGPGGVERDAGGDAGGDVGGCGLIAEYAKIHPFSFGREPEAFVGGTQIVTYPWRAAEAKGLTVSPAICYDLRFPELFRLAMLQGAECFALGACWPEARREHWRALTIARAIENQAYMLACNRTGSDPHLQYAGGSIVVDPKGRVLGELGDEESVLSVEIDPELLHRWRESFGAWRDVRLMRSGFGGPERD